MPVYHYVALNHKGAKEKGIIEAESVKQCRQLIRNKGLLPLETYSARQTKRKNGEAKFTGKSASNYTVSNKELALISRQLATLFAAGMPVEEVLTAVAEQTEKPRTKSLMSSVRSRVTEGHALANALRDFPRAFSNLFCSTVAAGEKSGHLDRVLDRLADYTEQQFYMRQKIKNALIYPSIMIFVSIGIVGFLLEFVVPKMVAVYSDTGQALPLMTSILIAISNGIKSYGLIAVGLVAVGLFFFRRHLKNDLHFRERIQHMALRIPIIGNATKVINTARFSRTFAILSSAGVSILEAMNISAQLITNIPIRKAVETATNRIREGANIHLALKQTNYFPPMSLHLIASGEASGQLENMLERAANNQDNEIKQLIETSLTLFEPAIILIMGTVVLFIVLAILLPIFQLDQMAG
ncbi:MAG: type II secretion system inner membrane protein GspF [Gammaproteobacteria bacterium]|nr:type II secretion system inner membrane protein GspF [Gammaproteobacteria bacterium]